MQSAGMIHVVFKNEIKKAVDTFEQAMKKEYHPKTVPEKFQKHINMIKTLLIKCKNTALLRAEIYLYADNDMPGYYSIWSSVRPFTLKLLDLTSRVTSEDLLSSELEERDQIIQHKASEVTELKKQKNTLSQQLQGLKQITGFDKVELAKKLADTERKLAELEKTETRLTALYDQAVKDRDAAQARCQTLGTENQQLCKALSILQTKYDQLTGEYKNLLAEYHTLLEQYQNLKTDHDNLEEKCNTLEEKVDACPIKTKKQLAELVKTLKNEIYAELGFNPKQQTSDSQQDTFNPTPDGA
jgi:DNA repair exonuclease SbcCD ATPase subunit